MSNDNVRKDAQRLIGYTRTSIPTGRTDPQISALETAGCEQVFIDRTVVGSTPPLARPRFKDAIAALRRGDSLVVYRLDRLTRDMVHFEGILQAIDDSFSAGAEDPADPEKSYRVLTIMLAEEY